MPDRNRQLGASTTAPTLAPPCTECRGFNVPALVRGRYQRGTCPACGGAGTAEAQQARSAAQVACATDGDFGHVVEPEPTPAKQPAPAVAAGEVMPLWNHFTAGAMSRGAFMSARVWVAYVAAGVCMGRVDAWGGPPRCTVEEAMRDADEAAVRAGHRIPADSMCFRPELADEAQGHPWKWRPGDEIWTYSGPCPVSAAVLRALCDEMPEGQAADALARILRVHGADVREVRS
jgi:hypothetical protein